MDKNNHRQDPESFTKPILKAIAYGVMAPNPHNTQAWAIDVVSDTELLIYAKHLLPETDPPARQILIGIGCFIELLCIGMSKDGYETKVEYLPKGDFEMNAFTTSAKPAARITITKTGKSKDALFDYIGARQSNRRQYSGDMVKQQEFEKLKALIGTTYSGLIFINDAEKMKPYDEIFSKAMDLETRTLATNEETRRMWRFSEKERREKKDGLSLPQMGFDGIIRFFAEMSFPKDKEGFNSEKNTRSVMANVNKAIYSSKGLVFFKTSTNNKIDWLKTGSDFARFNIALVPMGLVTSHYNQVIQEYVAMQPLQKEFDALTKTKGEEKIQIIVRIGRAKPVYPSWRKNVEDFIIKK